MNTRVKVICYVEFPFQLYFLFISKTTNSLLNQVMYALIKFIFSNFTYNVSSTYVLSVYNNVAN